MIDDWYPKKVSSSLNYYRSLKKFPTEITKDFLISKKVVEKDEKFNVPIEMHGLMYICDKGYNICYTTVEKKLGDSNIIFLKHNGSDGFFNITVYNANYAKLRFPFNKITTGYAVDFHEDQNGTFILPDFTYENPLFRNIYADWVIETDGTLISYSNIWIDNSSRKTINFSNSDCGGHPSTLFSENKLLAGPFLYEYHPDSNLLTIKSQKNQITERNVDKID